MVHKRNKDSTLRTDESGKEKEGTQILHDTNNLTETTFTAISQSKWILLHLNYQYIIQLTIPAFFFF